MPRDLVFVSHANPEDNTFSLWITLQLAKEGYPVWSDLTRLLGGEDFWSDIDEIIRNHTIKFLYVLSRTSNHKVGPLRELQVAEIVAREQKIEDFIIPLHIDDLPYREAHIQLITLNAIPFEHGWAAGLAQLLKKLDQDGIGKSAAFNPPSVATWWRDNFSATEGVTGAPEECVSNWLPVQFPEAVHVHTLGRRSIGEIKVPDSLPYPAIQQGQNLISFAFAEDFEGRLGECEIEQTDLFATDTLLGEHPPAKIGNRKQSRDIIVKLLGRGWEGMLQARGLPSYELANGRRCFYFSKGLASADDWVRYADLDGETHRRQLSGYRTIRRPDGSATKRYWHFGIHAFAKAYPECTFVITPHVVFSNDGEIVWSSKKKLHNARRRQCRDWWNDTWRDRILASVSWLGGEDDYINLSAGNSAVIRVSTSPIRFLSPSSYEVSETSILSPGQVEEPEEEYADEQFDDDIDEE